MVLRGLGPDFNLKYCWKHKAYNRPAIMMNWMKIFILSKATKITSVSPTLSI